MALSLQYMNHSDWIGDVDECDFVRQYARDWPIEDDHIEDVEYALGSILADIDPDGEMHPEARGLLAEGLRVRLERMPRA